MGALPSLLQPRLRPQRRDSDPVSTHAVAEELYGYMCPAGGHEPCINQVADRRLAWCPACGMFVRCRREDIPDGCAAADLVDALNEEHDDAR